MRLPSDTYQCLEPFLLYSTRPGTEFPGQVQASRHIRNRVTRRKTLIR